MQDLELFPEQPSTLAPPSSSVVNPDGQEVEELSSRNQALAGKVHEKTGVPYERVVTMGPNGHYIAIVVPQFDYFFSVTLPQDLFLASDSKQFAYANSQLKSAVEKSVDLQKKFSADQLAQIRAGKRPKGYTWHHDAPLGLLLLVDSDLHAKSAHTGKIDLGWRWRLSLNFYLKGVMHGCFLEFCRTHH